MTFGEPAAAPPDESTAAATQSPGWRSTYPRALRSLAFSASSRSTSPRASASEATSRRSLTFSACAEDARKSPAILVHTRVLKASDAFSTG